MIDHSSKTKPWWVIYSQIFYGKIVFWNMKPITYFIVNSKVVEGLGSRWLEVPLPLMKWVNSTWIFTKMDDFLPFAFLVV